MLEMLISLSVAGSVLALLLLLLRRALGRRIPSTFYYYAWLLVLLRFVLPVPGLMRLERPAAQSTPVAQVQQPLRENTPRPAVTFVPVQTVPSPRGELETRQEPTHTASERVQTQSYEAPAQRAKPGVTLPLAQLLGLVWCAGAMGWMLYDTVGYLRFSQALNRTLRPAREQEQTIFEALDGPARLRLCRSPGVGTPMQLGLADARLVLPERAYTDEMLSNILRHELTHYSRRDIAYKWFMEAVCAIHWFNPVVWIARRELARLCELSCDEQLLQGMTPNQKRSYGQTLLELASDRAAPRQVIATSFATQKRNLKERLEQIMTYKKSGRRTLALLLCAALLLCGCAAAVGPAGDAKEPVSSEELMPVTYPTQAPESAEATAAPGGEGGTIEVSTVDELLAAIAPNATIVLAADTFDLTTASTYPEVDPEDAAEYRMDGYPETVSAGAYCSWNLNYCDGYELVISGVDNLAILAQEGREVNLVTEPRYSHVVRFSGCSGIRVEGLTVGHSKGAGGCVGAVLDFERTDAVAVDRCRLYGCGTWGVQADDCRSLRVTNTAIYDCSQGAVNLSKCYDALLTDCDFYQINAYDSLFSFSQCSQVAVTNSHVQRNMANRMVYCDGATQGVSFLGVQLSGNAFFDGLYASMKNSIVFDGCLLNPENRIVGTFASNDMGSVPAVDSQGRVLTDDDIRVMELKRAGTWEAEQRVLPEKPQPSDDGMIHVDNVDAFLAAIGPDTTIYLEPGNYDLTTAADYGSMGGEYYTWGEEFDGYSLVIQYVGNLTILAESPNKVTLETVPRYADVLRFENCHDITLQGFTAGHTVEPGSCAGDVLGFVTSQGIRVENCSLFGCGVIGIHAEYCSQMAVENTEIHHCEYAAASLWGCTNVTFTSCNIHDNGSNTVDVYNSQKVTIDGNKLA